MYCAIANSDTCTAASQQSVDRKIDPVSEANAIMHPLYASAQRERAMDRISSHLGANGFQTLSIIGIDSMSRQLWRDLDGRPRWLGQSTARVQPDGPWPNHLCGLLARMGLFATPFSVVAQHRAPHQEPVFFVSKLGCSLHLVGSCLPNLTHGPMPMRVCEEVTMQLSRHIFSCVLAEVMKAENPPPPPLR